MPTQQPMTPEEVFAGLDFRTNEGREGTTFYFPGHQSRDQISKTYFALYPEHRSEEPHKIVTDSIRHTWHTFTLHEDTCFLITDDDADDPFTPEDLEDPTLCTCEAQTGLDDGTGYEYRHPHPADAHTPGSIPVTWVTIMPLVPPLS